MRQVLPVHDVRSAFDLVDTDAGARARVVPERGGMIISWEALGRNLLYLERETYADSSRNVRGGIPVLFPISGRLKNDSYIRGNRSISMPQHGFARRRPWRVAAVESERASVTVALSPGDDTLQSYPFPFDLSIQYRVAGSSLEVILACRNRSDMAMPVYPGLHPYFSITQKDSIRLEVPASRCIDNLTGELMPILSPIDWNASEVNRIYGDLTGRRAAILLHDGSKIRIEYGGEIETLVFWTLKGKPFVCLEPCLQVGDMMNDPGRVHVVPAGGELRMRTLFTFLPSEEGNGTGSANYSGVISPG